MCFAASTYYGRHVARVPGGTCILVATKAVCYTGRCLLFTDLGVCLTFRACLERLGKKWLGPAYVLEAAYAKTRCSCGEGASHYRSIITPPYRTACSSIVLVLHGVISRR